VPDRWVSIPTPQCFFALLLWRPLFSSKTFLAIVHRPIWSNEDTCLFLVPNSLKLSHFYFLKDLHALRPLEYERVASAIPCARVCMFVSMLVCMYVRMDGWMSASLATEELDESYSYFTTVRYTVTNNILPRNNRFRFQCNVVKFNRICVKYVQCLCTDILFTENICKTSPRHHSRLPFIATHWLRNHWYTDWATGWRTGKSVRLLEEEEIFLFTAISGQTRRTHWASYPTDRYWGAFPGVKPPRLEAVH
jgi:hypothetical protein